MLTATENKDFIIDALNVKCNGQAQYIETLEKEIEALKADNRALRIERTWLKIELKQTKRKLSAKPQPAIKEYKPKYTERLEEQVYTFLLNPEFIIEKVAAYFHISPEDIKAGKLKRNITHPRHWALYLIDKYTLLSRREMGFRAGLGDHSSVCKAIRDMKVSVAEKPEYKAIAQALDELLQPQNNLAAA